MHREIQIKQFPIVTTHWWPKTRNERFVWENQQYLYRFLPLVHNHVQVIWVHTHIRCVTCVCVWRVCVCVRALTEGVSEAWCWRAVIVTTTNHILLWCCMNGIGYLHEAIWLADASVGAWKVEKFSTSAASSASEATRPTIQFGKRLTSLHSKSTRGIDADAPCEWGVSLRKLRKAPEVISRAYTSLSARAHTHTSHTHTSHTHTSHTHTSHTHTSHTHTSHTGCVCALRSLGHGCVQEVKNDINTVSFLTQTARFVS